MRHWILASALALASLPSVAADLIDFWDTPRHGGNSFNRLPPDQAYFEALKGYGATWVRLSYDKWKPERRDFLMGDADAYKGLVAADLASLKATLDNAHAAGLKVVIAPLSLPGMRWAQNNQGTFDDRLWQDKAYWAQAADFWRDLALALKGHPAVAAYNLINEPAPEMRGGLAEHAEPGRMRQWYAQAQGSARDLPAFYRQVVAAIREVDTVTPVMLDAGWYAAADAFGYWPAPLQDARVLYSLHEDVLTVLDQNKLHWAFYSFREDNWDGMDYELGSAKVPWRYWQAIDKGEPDPLVRQATAEFEPIRQRLAR